MRDLSAKELLQRMSRLVPPSTRVVVWKYSNNSGQHLKGLGVSGRNPQEGISYRELLEGYRQISQTRFPPRQLCFEEQTIRELSSREVAKRVRKLSPDAWPLLFEKHIMEGSEITVLKGFRPSIKFGFTNFFSNYRATLAHYERTLNEKRSRNLS